MFSKFLGRGRIFFPAAELSCKIGREILTGVGNTACNSREGAKKSHINVPVPGTIPVTVFLPGEIKRVDDE
jgi:hypothetical protein